MLGGLGAVSCIWNDVETMGKTCYNMVIITLGKPWEKQAGNQWLPPNHKGYRFETLFVTKSVGKALLSQSRVLLLDTVKAKSHPPVPLQFRFIFLHKND